MLGFLGKRCVLMSCTKVGGGSQGSSVQEEILSCFLLMGSLRKPWVEMSRRSLEVWRADLEQKEELGVLI